jgi:hypothetical protein
LHFTFEFVHEVEFIMQTACGIDDDDIGVFATALARYQSHRSRIAAHLLFYKRHACGLLNL